MNDNWGLIHLSPAMKYCGIYSEMTFHIVQLVAL